MILVTGATGFIGTNLVQQLVAQGESVRILRRQSSDMRGLSDLTIEDQIGDVTDQRAVRTAMRGCRRVFHLAGSVDISPSAAARARRTNVLGGTYVAEAALDEGVERFVYTSSAVTAGVPKEGGQVDEQSEYNLEDVRLPYVATKKEAEDRILEYVRQGLPGIIVNPGYVFGAWDKRPKLNQFLILAAKGKLNFYFSGGLSVVDVRDVARAHILAMEKGRIGERYILSNENLSYRDFFTQINATLQRPEPRWPLPYAVFAALGLAAEIGGRLLRVEPTISRALAKLYSANHFLNWEKARRELGYTATPIQESLRTTFDWLQEFGYT